MPLQEGYVRDKIVLIDGHSILNRAFYGVPDLTNAEGLHTNAVYGFLNILFRILEEEKPQYLAVAFDVHAPTFRHRMYEAYKGTRHPMPQELHEQVPVIQEMLQAMKVPLLTKEGYEADDLLGTVAGRCEREGLDVTIVSGDRDLLQLATEHVLIRIPKTKGGKTQISDYHTADVQEEYGLTPSQIIELKALMGDSSDNIPGLPGVGVKTATAILQQYGSIEEAHAHIDEIRPPKAQKAMREHWELAVLSKKLATIDTDAPVDTDLAVMAYTNLFTPEAYQICKRLEFKKMLTLFEQPVRTERPETRIVTELSEVTELFRKAAEAERVGIHVLSDPLMDRSAVPAGLGMAFSAEESVYIPVQGFLTAEYLGGELRKLTETTELCVWQLKELLQAFALPYSSRWFDTHLAAYLLDPLKSTYAYDTIAAEYGSLELRSQEEIFGSGKRPVFADADEGKAAAYAGETAVSALVSAAPLQHALADTGMKKLYDEIELPLVWTLQDMERAGVKILPDALQSYGENLQEGIRRLEEKIYEEAEERFNIQSPKQLGEILFEKMKLPGGKKTKTGYSTAADVLEKLAPDVPLVADVLEYRQLAKLKSTYADGLAAFVADDGRIHSTFHQTITATGRLSSADPNLQNIPVRVELGRQIRKVFVPEDGCVFIDADYSQIELRVLASMSGDEKLIEAYRMAKDIHAITASQVFHVPFEDVTPLMRRNAKAVNFGIVYGISSFGLSQDLDISRKEAADYIESYYETYPAIRSFLEGLVTAAKERGYAETLYGRRRPMPELSSGNFMQRQFGERVAKNAPIQGTAADIIKIAMLRVHRRLAEEGLQSRLVLQVHDELLIEAEESEADAVRRILEEEMTGAAELAVKLEIDMHEGRTWYDAK